MDLFEWDKKYETGISLIDHQHQELFERINKLLLSFYEGTEVLELIRLSNFLTEYVNLHFSTEEQLFVKYNYPEKDEHIKEHNSFRMLQRQIEADVAKRRVTLTYSVEIENRLKNWWDSHIMLSDMKYVPFLKDKN